jgi:RNA polymerase sigma-70 factor (ECF subfamily)
MKDADVVPGENPGDAGASSVTPSSLLQRLRLPDPDAWPRLVALYGPTVTKWCRHAGLSAEDADDLGQEVWQAVHRRLADFRRDRPGDSFRGWLCTITRRKLRDHWRRPGRQVPTAATGGSGAYQQLAELPADEPAASDAEDRRDLFQRALRLIQVDFEEKTWQAFWRLAVEGQAVPDVAAALGMTPDAVYIARHRVGQRLREEFEHLL